MKIKDFGPRLGAYIPGAPLGFANAWGVREWGKYLLLHLWGGDILCE